jgi:hypothetical protein
MKKYLVLISAFIAFVAGYLLFGGLKSTSAHVPVCYSCPQGVVFNASQTLYEGDSVTYSSWGSWSSWSGSNYCSNSDEDAGLCEDEKQKIDGDWKYRRHYRTIVHTCPAGYTYDEQDGPNDCYKVENFSVIFDYQKSADPTKCHRPTGSTLAVPSWAMSKFNTEKPETINGTVVTCPVATDTPTPTPGDEVLPTPSEEPTVAPTTPSCGADEHLSLEGTKCLKWELGGAPAPVGGAQVLGTSITGGQVLGTNTMAKTGMAEEAIFNLIFSLGMGLTGFGIRKVSKSSVK